jgi:hypothetical protein
MPMVACGKRLDYFIRQSLVQKRLAKSMKPDWAGMIRHILENLMNSQYKSIFVQKSLGSSHFVSRAKNAFICAVISGFQSDIVYFRHIHWGCEKCMQNTRSVCDRYKQRSSGYLRMIGSGSKRRLGLKLGFSFDGMELKLSLGIFPI